MGANSLVTYSPVLYFAINLLGTMLMPIHRRENTFLKTIFSSFVLRTDFRWKLEKKFEAEKRPYLRINRNKENWLRKDFGNLNTRIVFFCKRPRRFNRNYKMQIRFTINCTLFRSVEITINWVEKILEIIQF